MTLTLEALLSGFRPEKERLPLAQAYKETIERAYGIVPEGELARIMELGGTADYADKPAMRYIGQAEIANAEAYLHVPFKSVGLLPLFDLHENDFVCYRLADGRYAAFNIIDLSEFASAAGLPELLGKLGWK